MVCEGFTPESTDAGPVLRAALMESVIEVTMKMMADQVVARERAVAAPRGPKAVWLPWPPKAAAMSPLLPLCSNTAPWAYLPVRSDPEEDHVFSVGS